MASTTTKFASVVPSTSIKSCSEPLTLRIQDCVRWYAVYTSANHEKRIAAQLSERSVDQFLPTYTSVRKWKDRRVTLDLPLFPGYIFVRLALRDRLRVLQVPGVAKLVGFGGIPAALPDADIEGLRSGLVSGIHAEPHPFLTAGRKVRVRHGPMTGLQGILVRRKSRTRLVISLELIQRAMAIEIDEADIEASS
jgi:transcription antitermination factor NusG